MLFLLIVYGDVSPEARGPFKNFKTRLAAARRHRQARGDKDGIFRLSIYPGARAGRRVEVAPFGGAELDFPGD